MNTWLAYKSNRAYVFQDYIWKREYYPWQSWIERSWPSLPHTPANALIAGPSVGGPWDHGDGAPRSVSEKWFDVVCPKKERRIINSEEVKPAIRWENGDVIFNHWQRILKDAPERCIEVQAASRSIDNFPQTFDLFLWGSDRILPLWENFKKSPVSRLLATSPVVESAISRNRYLFQPRGPSLPTEAPRNVFDRMLAIHLRRGDFQQACLDLANWNSTFYSWNLHPSLPDKFVNPPGYTWGKNTPDNIEFYSKRCYPTDEAILEKIERSRSDYIQSAKPGETRYLDTLYILTNDKTGWVNTMIPFLRTHGWRIVVTTQDLVLDQEQKDVGMAIDMEYARLAAVFIGNGVRIFYLFNILHLPFSLIDEILRFCFFPPVYSGHRLRVILCIGVWSMGRRQLALGFIDIYMIINDTRNCCCCFCCCCCWMDGCFTGMSYDSG